LNPGQATTLSVQFDPIVEGLATGQLTITSNSSTNSTIVISLSGTGGGAGSGVALSWIAPSGSPVSLVGYNVFRSPGGSSAYQLLNSSPEPETAYTDSTVQSGQSYDYIVESVDFEGVESVPSNMFNVTIP
jgi:fibronectin type 3 domain-containing protein